MLLGPSANMHECIIIEKKGMDNLYRLTTKLTVPKKHQLWKLNTDLPKLNNSNEWQTAKKNNTPMSGTDSKRQNCAQHDESRK